MEECSFAPKLYKKRQTVAKEQDSLPRRVKPGAPKQSVTKDQESDPRNTEPTQDDDYDGVRDVDTFVADQERFL